MSVLPSGEQWEFAAGSYRGTVVSVGGGLRGLWYEGRELLLGYPAEEPAQAGIGQHLIPWPNRIIDGRYTFDGVEQQLYLTEPPRGNAIHGLTRWANWERVDDGSDPAVVVTGYRLHGQPGYPHQLELRISYLLDEGGLAVTVSAVNVGSSAAPYGYGAHPYLTVGRVIDECELEFRAARWLETTPEQLAPVGLRDVPGSEFDFSSARSIGAIEIDNAFTGLGDAWTVILTDSATGHRASLSGDTGWVQLYTAGALDRQALAVEPMTCPPNAFVTGEDLVVLQPGDSEVTTFRVSG